MGAGLSCLHEVLCQKGVDFVAFAEIKAGANGDKNGMLSTFLGHRHGRNFVCKRGENIEDPPEATPFCYDFKSKVYWDSKQPGHIALTCDGGDLSKMGCVWGEVHNACGGVEWLMPKDGVRMRTVEPAGTPAGQAPAPGTKADVIVFVKINESTTPEEYETLFWSHAKEKKVTGKGQTVELAMSRSEFCDEAKTRLLFNIKEPKQAMILIYDADLAKTGSVLGSEAFQSIGKAMWEMKPSDVQYMSSPIKSTEYAANEDDDEEPDLN